MSLDVYLQQRGAKPPIGSGIFVRENGSRREISREEWDAAHPGQEPVVLQYEANSEEEYGTVFTWNITHNLNTMAVQAGLYQVLWHPEQLGLAYAHELTPLLESGLAKLKARPEHFKKFNPANGWGTYENLVEFVENYLEACKAYPEAEVFVSR